jgi:hypothetical protein
MLEVTLFSTAAGRCQPADFLGGLEKSWRVAIMTDIEAVATHGFRAPASVKAIKGHRPMCEIRTGGFRTFFAIKGNTLWVLHICKKQDQERGIDAASSRMRDL